MRTIVQGRHLDIVTYRNRIGGTNATNTEIALHMAIRGCAVWKIYAVACAC